MKKDVLLTINAEQHFEGDSPETVNLVTQARLYNRNGKYYVSYDESELTGLKGTHTLLKLDGKNVSLVRTGTYPSEMLFVENERHVGLYQTEFGTLTISTHTSAIVNDIDDNGGHLHINYTIEVDNSMIGQHSFDMLVEPTGGDLDQ